MEVHEVLADWEESYRDREWLSLEEAAARVREADLKRMILDLPDFYTVFSAV